MVLTVTGESVALDLFRQDKVLSLILVGVSYECDSELETGPGA